MLSFDHCLALYHISQSNQFQLVETLELKCHTPNTIVVFRNEKPDLGQLSQDIWKISQIRVEDFLDVTEKY